MNQIIGGTITADSGVYFLGTTKGVKRLKKRGVRMMIDADVSFIGVSLVGDEFRTYGTVGGSMAPYLAIQWAYENLTAFGIEIVDDGEKKRPAIWVDSHAAVIAMFNHIKANSNAQPFGAGASA